MKFKQYLACMMAAAMVVSASPVIGMDMGTVLAAEETKKARAGETEITAQPEVVVSIPKAGEKLSNVAELVGKEIETRADVNLELDKEAMVKGGAIKGRITDKEPTAPNSIFNVTGNKRLLFRMQIKSDKPTEDGIQALIGKMNNQYGVQMETSGGTVRIYFYGKLTGGWAESSYTIPDDFDWSAWHDLVAYFDGNQMLLYMDGKESTSNREIKGELVEAADAVFTIGYNYQPKQGGQTLEAGWDYQGWYKDVNLYIGDKVPATLDITKIDEVLKGTKNDFTLTGKASELEKYLSVKASWSPADEVLDKYKDYDLSVVLSAKDTYKFKADATAVLRTDKEALQDVKKEVAANGKTMTLTYSVKGEKHPKELLKEYLESAEVKAIGSKNEVDGKRKYTIDSWNSYVAVYNRAIQPEDNLSPEDYTALLGELKTAVGGLQLAAETCECTLGSITGFEGQTLDITGKSKITVTLGTGSYGHSSDCVKHEGKAAVESYELVGSPEGVTLTGNELIITKPGTIEVKLIVNLGDHRQEATATFIVKEAENAKDKQALDSSVQAAGKLIAAGQGNYTDDSWKAFSDAYKKAKEASAGTDSATLIALKTKLESAQKALTKKVVEEPKKITVAKAKVKKAKKVGKKLTITLKKINGVQGYQISVSKAKKFGKKLKLKTVTTKKTTVTIKKLKSVKNYYVKARAYKVDNGKKYYGKWSVVKKASIKK